MRGYKPYIGQTPGEVIDQLGSMMLMAPKFIDSTGVFPQSIDTEFEALNGGLEVIRGKLGEERYQTMRAMSDRMRALFEADPDDVGQEGIDARKLIDEMQRMLRQRRRK